MKKYTLLILLIVTISHSFSQAYNFSLNWHSEKIKSQNGDVITINTFNDASFDDASNLPVFYQRIRVNGDTNYNVQVSDIGLEPVLDDNLLSLLPTNLGSNLEIESAISQYGGQAYLSIEIFPFVTDPASGLASRLRALTIHLNPSSKREANKTRDYAENSVLSEGEWYKIAISNTGIHKISYSELSSLGIDIDHVNPQNIRMYGNGGAMLPEDLSLPRYDDLQEIAIQIKGEEDGVFDSGDYILFYGRGVNAIKQQADGDLYYEKNIYTTHTYYFIKIDTEQGLRIDNQANINQTENQTVNSYGAIFHHEIDEVNLNHSGRMWLGEKFDFTTAYEFEYNIQNLDISQPLSLEIHVAANSKKSSWFSFYNNNNFINKTNISAISSTSLYPQVAKLSFSKNTFTTTSKNLKIKIEYDKPLSSSIGYLDYFSIFAKCHLQYTNKQIIFSDTNSVGNQNITKFNISSSQNIDIWDVSDPLKPKKQEITHSGTNFSFKIHTDELHRFVVSSGNDKLQAEMIGGVACQNLHNIQNVDMLIISAPEFESEAQRLSAYHITHDNMNVQVVTPQLIYNEFSSGGQDITAIRDFIKMVYDKSLSGHPLKYVLFFGDGSYDYRGIEYPTSNFVPTWENKSNPMDPIDSYASDDFFGKLTPDDDILNVALGRFVVNTLSQAKGAVEKTFKYVSNTPEVMGAWRNTSCIIADDDGGSFIPQGEEIETIINDKKPNINLDKIYLDAYERVSTPSGDRYPGVEDAISRRLAKGSLILHYIGHGGEAGWAHERIVKISDIANWKNSNNLPVFITATCELSRFDNPGRVSAGELMFINPRGGAIALYTTTRPTFSYSNQQLGKKIYLNLLSKIDGKYVSMGEALQRAKNNQKLSENTEKYVFLGDPSIHLAIPENKIEITNISTDTIKALSHITISGKITDSTGTILNDFNGTTIIKILDKPVNYSTLGSVGNPVIQFKEQDHVIYNGAVSTVNGLWSVSFIVPKDIIYEYGLGKISLYAYSDDTDAAGNKSIVIGGINENYSIDETSPEVKISINDWYFRSGGITNENPIMLSTIFDESGINTTGSGIGHNLELNIDNTKHYIVNDFYETEINDYTHGHINFPLFNLPDGPHTMTLRVWDVYNNSASTSIDFLVVSSTEMAIQYLMNYPNPFTQASGTQFMFEHNQSEEEINIELQIFSTSGKHITTIKDFSNNGNFIYQSGQWSGRDMNGNLIPGGMYIFKLIVKNPEGKYDTATSKLIFLR
jgi:hypothetical protein